MNRTLTNLLTSLLIAAALIAAGGSDAMAGKDLMERVEHGYADNNGVKIHYVSVGEGPMVLFIHGFPDFWYGWAHQMEALEGDFKCVAMDLRGYNKSDAPEGVENYDMSLLIGDVIAVIKANGVEKATIVAHDWGGGIAWQVALNVPEVVENLIICNLPHPRGLARELLINDSHRANTAYARNFQKPDAHEQMTAEGLAGMLSMQGKPGTWDADKKAKYVAAFEKSDFNAMLHYYRRNYNPEIKPKAELPYVDETPIVFAKMPVLMFHGLKDSALHHHALNNTWEWMEKDLTIVTVPDAGHWVQNDAAELVSSTIKWWLISRK